MGYTTFEFRINRRILDMKKGCFEGGLIAERMADGDPMVLSIVDSKRYCFSMAPLAAPCLRLVLTVPATHCTAGHGIQRTIASCFTE